MKRLLPAFLAFVAMVRITARSGLPNPTLTPGATNPDVTHATIEQTFCKRGWTKTVRTPKSLVLAQAQMLQ